MSDHPDRTSYDDKLAHILQVAAAVMAEKGYDGTSVRDISRASGVSLAGLYYYFRSKEELLFMIQTRCFGTVLEQLEQRLADTGHPRARLHALVVNHLRFFGSNMTAMKVLSHEGSTLSGGMGETVDAQKRRYRQICQGILEELGVRERGLSPRVATYSLFGMLNWIYNWYRPGQDVPLEELADQMVQLFLEGCAPPTAAKLTGGTT